MKSCSSGEKLCESFPRKSRVTAVLYVNYSPSMCGERGGTGGIDPAYDYYILLYEILQHSNTYLAKGLIHSFSHHMDIKSCR